jgi:hypothetical protein
MRAVFITVALFVSIALPGRGFAGQGAQSKDREQILALEQAIGKAISDGDVAAYDKLTSADFQFITGAGAIVSKRIGLRS